MHVDELATRVSHAEAQTGYGDGRDHDRSGQWARPLTAPEDEHHGRQQRRDTARPHKLLGCLLVGFNGALRNHPFNPFFVVAPRIDGDEARSQERGLRATSEATVRQQAPVVYRKSGLRNRSDLSAFFLEDLLLPRSAA